MISIAMGNTTPSRMFVGVFAPVAPALSPAWPCQPDRAPSAGVAKLVIVYERLPFALCYQRGESLSMNRSALMAVLLLLAALVTACASPTTPTPTAAPTAEAATEIAATPTSAVPLTNVVLYLAFRPNVQFAPFYVGIQKGFFANHGFDVSISHQDESTAVRLLGTRGSDSGLALAVVSGEQVLLGRAQEIPVIYVYEWFERFPVAIASKPDRGIAPRRSQGHSIGVLLREGASYIGLRALLAVGGLSESDVTIQETGFTQVETLLAGVTEAVVVYSNNEPIQLEAAGQPVNLIQVSDHIQLVSNGLIVNEATAQNQPDLVRAFLAAFSEALQYTIDNPDEAFEISQSMVEGLTDPARAERRSAGAIERRAPASAKHPLRRAWTFQMQKCPDLLATAGRAASPSSEVRSTTFCRKVEKLHFSDSPSLSEFLGGGRRKCR
jgi:NitT/TauT family transport system substrate-binding protein